MRDTIFVNHNARHFGLRTLIISYVP